MANEIKHYFLAPSWDYPPNGSIALGNIVRSPEKIVPPLYIHQSTNSEPMMQSSTKFGVDWSRATETERGFGIWAKFMQIIGLGIDFGLEMKIVDRQLYHFERIDTEEYFPDEETIRKSVNSTAVKSYIEKSRFTKDVYMIVGIKKVYGARIASVVDGRRGGVLKVALHGMALTSAPISIGPQGKYESIGTNTMSFEGSTDFVFAFRLRKVRIREEKVEQDDYNKGALLSEQVDTVFIPEAFTVLGLENADACAKDFGLDDEIVTDGQEKSRVATQKSLRRDWRYEAE